MFAIKMGQNVRRDILWLSTVANMTSFDSYNFMTNCQSKSYDLNKGNYNKKIGYTANKTTVVF